MQAKKVLVGSGLVLALVSALGLVASLPAGAQTSTKPATSTTTRADDDAAEFAKLDKNHDGYIDKTEAVMEPRLLAKFGEADLNKDGKVNKDEFLKFEKARHASK